MRDTDKALDRMGITRSEIAERLEPGTSVGWIIPNLYKAYFSGLSKEDILALLEAGYTFNYQDPKSRAQLITGYPNDTVVRLGICQGDMEMVVISTKMRLSLSELTEMIEKGAKLQDLKVIYELS